MAIETGASIIWIFVYIAIYYIFYREDYKYLALILMMANSLVGFVILVDNPQLGFLTFIIIFILFVKTYMENTKKEHRIFTR